MVVVVTARTSPSLGGVVYDVHDCVVDRHNKKNSSFLRTNIATEQVAVQFSKFYVYRSVYILLYLVTMTAA